MSVANNSTTNILIEVADNLPPYLYTCLTLFSLSLLIISVIKAPRPCFTPLRQFMIQMSIFFICVTIYRYLLQYAFSWTFIHLCTLSCDMEGNCKRNCWGVTAIQEMLFVFGRWCYFVVPIFWYQIYSNVVKLQEIQQSKRNHILVAILYWGSLMIVESLLFIYILLDGIMQWNTSSQGTVVFFAFLDIIIIIIFLWFGFFLKRQLKLSGIVVVFSLRNHLKIITWLSICIALTLMLNIIINFGFLIYRIVEDAFYEHGKSSIIIVLKMVLTQIIPFAIILSLVVFPSLCVPTARLPSKRPTSQSDHILQRNSIDYNSAQKYYQKKYGSSSKSLSIPQNNQYPSHDEFTDHSMEYTNVNITHKNSNVWGSDQRSESDSLHQQLLTK